MKVFTLEPGQKYTLTLNFVCSDVSYARQRGYSAETAQRDIANVLRDFGEVHWSGPFEVSDGYFRDDATMKVVFTPRARMVTSDYTNRLLYGANYAIQATSPVRTLTRWPGTNWLEYDGGWNCPIDDWSISVPRFDHVVQEIQRGDNRVLTSPTSVPWRSVESSDPNRDGRSGASLMVETVSQRDPGASVLSAVFGAVPVSVWVIGGVALAVTTYPYWKPLAKDTLKQLKGVVKQ